MKNSFSLPKQLHHRLGAFVDEAHGAAQGGFHFLGGIDSQRVAKAGVEVVRIHGALGGEHGVLVGLANHLPTPDATAGYESTEAARVMIAPGVGVNARGAAEFAEHEHQRLGEFTTGGEIGN